MAESDYTIKKRMRFSSSSSSSVRGTTSKSLMASELRNHSNRSTVRFAPAVSHIRNRFLTDLRNQHASPPLSDKIVTKSPRACPRVTVRNLCLRRVSSSPSSISSDWDFHVKGQNQTKELNVESPCDSPNANVVRIGSNDIIEVVECSQTTSPDSEMFISVAGSIRQEIDGVSLKNVGVKLGSKIIRHPEKIFKNPGSVSYRRLLPYLKKASDDTRSRDADTKDSKNERDELMVGDDRLSPTGSVLLSPNSFVEPPAAQNLHGNISPFKKMTSSSATKIPLCSKRKLFKVPGSVNYKRMLSYLRDSSEDNPGMPETSKHIDLQKNIEKISPATENKGATTEAKDLNTCSNNVESTPLSDPDNEQETQTFVSSV
ncbi:PREDICTED: uncharacterized protein LOC104719043 [Camelina sativa]|uniref:Uncharacterized protein LOC104719043 n=1 Tax=Camelina sativa TaxID=90675 RepID=A0ABM0U3B5_CAMSA|nr:PREDICTED: uncharacterized protein LOC104719043 [Camelina sativa]